MKYCLAYLLFIGIVVLVAAEAFLRITGKYATYPELIGLKYTSYYNASYPTWYIRRAPNQNFTPPNTDFHYPYAINNLGLREKNFEKNKPDSAIRIFATGDSFSEGQGASYDSTWPHLLSHYLADDGVNAEVLNTGVAGSDPVYNYMFHRDILNGYKADYLIISINSSDFTDYMLRGGFERFHSDTTTHYVSGPWYEPLYHYSYFARGFIEWVGRFPFRGIFSNEHDFAVSADKAMDCYSAAIDSFSNLVSSDSTKIMVLLYSTPSDIRYKNNEMEIFRQSFINLQQRLAKKNIACINLWDDLKTRLIDKDYNLYTYNNDSHYKPYGYNLMAQLVEKNLIEKGIIPFKKP